MKRAESGQATLEFAVLTGAVIFPVVFGIIFLCQILWIWHSVVEFTRDGARYAATHCWEAGGNNVISYMKANVPPMIGQNQFQDGTATIQVNFYSQDPATGVLSDFSCDTECSTACIPDTVTVQVTNYQYQGFGNYLGLLPVAMPSFQTSSPVEGAGCDPEQGTCTP